MTADSEESRYGEAKKWSLVAGAVSTEDKIQERERRQWITGSLQQ
jgi:hypothetical protein